MKSNSKFGVLLILDGFGIRKERDYNCIALARTPVYDYLVDNNNLNGSEYNKTLGKTYYTDLIAVGSEVGMPGNAKGSTAVGHEVISGVDYSHPMVTIEKDIKNKVMNNAVIDKALNNVIKHDSALHLMGLVSPNREHSDIKHLYALLERAKELGVKKIWIHFFADGRGTPPFSAVRYAEDLFEKAEDIFGPSFKDFKIATIGGRDIAMNRSGDSWHKTERTYRAIIEADAPVEKNIFAALKKSYGKGITDEYTAFKVLGDYKGAGNHDSFIHWNFRKDRTEPLMRMLTADESEITRLLKESPDTKSNNITRFERLKSNKKLDYSTLFFTAFMEYYKGIDCPVAFREPEQKNSLGSVLEDFGFKQYRLSGAEKEKAVALLSGGTHPEHFANENRFIITLPEDLRKYKNGFDENKGETGFRLNPSARFPKLELPELKKKILSLVNTVEDDTFIIANICNPDIVGHTADLGAGIITVEEIDRTLLEIGQLVKKKGGFLVIVADHGNIEKLLTEDWEPNTFHTDSMVPFIILGIDDLNIVKNNGSLRDVAPTILHLLRPEEKEFLKNSFKGTSLVEYL